MLNEKISVIVPVYKVEKYLHKCVDSIISQTYENLEIILVDDGSPDNCPQICDEYAKKDSRIRVIHKENEGISATRNTGIQAAQGEYIGFIDSDDYVAPQMFEKLYNAIKKHDADISICNFYYTDDNGNILDKDDIRLPIKDEYISGNKVLSEKFFMDKRHYWIVPWNKLYRREVLKNVKYPVGKVHEDEDVAAHIYHGNMVECISDRLIYYVQRQGSIMSEKDSEKCINKTEAFINLSKFYIENKYNNEVIFISLNTINQYMKNNYVYLKSRKKENGYNVKEYRKILKKCIFKDFNMMQILRFVLNYIDPYGHLLMIIDMMKK